MSEEGGERPADNFKKTLMPPIIKEKRGKADDTRWCYREL